MKRLISFLLAAIMCINLANIALADIPEFTVIENNLGGYEPIENLGIIEADDVTEYVEPAIMALSLEPDWVNNGGRYYYDHLGTLDNGEDLQGFYNKLYRNMKRYIYDYNAKTSSLTFETKDSEGNVISSFTDDFLCIEATDYYNSIGWDTMCQVYNAVLQDNPQLFYIDLSICGVSSSGNVFFAIQIADEYLDGSARMDEADAITAGVDEYDAVINTDMTNYAIEKKVHDKLILDNNYALDSNDLPLDTRYAHSIAGSLNKNYGGGVCESYAKAFQLLLNRYNVPCYFVAGKVTEEIDGEITEENHAWNYVQLDDGNYYCVDVTWDDPVTGTEQHILRYEYFNMPNSQFYNGDKTRDNSLTYYSEALPQCSDSDEYYTKKPNVYASTADNGDYILTAPDVSEDGSRTVTTTTEATTETTTSKTYEYSTEATTSVFQDIAPDSIKKDFVVTASNCYQGNLTDNDRNVVGKFACAINDTGEISIILDEACYVEFTIQFYNNNEETIGNVMLYVDDELQGTYTESSVYNVKVPQGQHKLKWLLYSPNNSYTMLHSVNVISMGDYNLDGEVDLKDIIGLLKADNVDISAFCYIDINDDGAVNGMDAAYILKHSAGII